MTSRQILNQTDLMVKNENLSDREIDLLNLIRDLNTRIDELQSCIGPDPSQSTFLIQRLNQLESRLSTVQDDILRVEKSVQTLADDYEPDAWRHSHCPRQMEQPATRRHRALPNAREIPRSSQQEWFEGKS